jgi:hypothetical protein
MDGRGRTLDDVSTERLGRSVKYEEIYHDRDDDLKGGRPTL